MSLLLRRITKSFDDQLVVNQLSLEVQAGELFVLLGSSGSGKSTVLRLISGLVPVDSGSVLHDDKDLTLLPPQQRQVGFVFQNYALFKHMTVSDNISFALRLRGVSKEAQALRVEELLDLVGLVGLDRRYPHELSGGQKQRVALARALAHQPKLLLLDEPFGALDQEIRVALRQNLARIQRALAITTILVTHDQEEAFALGDRVGVIDRGLLIESGKPEDLYSRPRTEHVAQFVGGGNVLVGRNQGGAISVQGERVALPESAPQHSEGAPVRILFRPEEVVFVAGGESRESAVLRLGSGVVAERTFAGPLRRYRIEIPDLQGLRSPIPRLQYGRGAVSILAVQPSGLGSALRVGDKIEVGVRSFHVLNPSSVRMLTVVDSHNLESGPIELGLYLGAKTHGFLSFASVVDDDRASTRVREFISACAARAQIKVDLESQLHLHQGVAKVGVVREAQTAMADVIIAAQPEVGKFSQGIETLLVRTGAPVLSVGKSWKPFRKILICTKAGEPGKSDILIGARLARHTDADVTVLHVQRENASVEHRRSVERHLEEASATLSSLRINHEISVVGGSVAGGIQSALASGQYELVVLGVAVQAEEAGKLAVPAFDEIPASVSVLLVPVL